MILTVWLVDDVLIETSWNVKPAAPTTETSADTVLIETSWNVKASD